HLSYRVGLKTFSAAESRSVLGVPDAHHLPATPGAGFLKTDAGAPARFHSAYVSGPAPADAAVGGHGPGLAAGGRVRVFAATCGSAETDGSGRDDAPETTLDRGPSQSTLDATVGAMAGHPHAAHRVWLPPLPARTALADAVDSSLPALTASIG